MTTTMTGTKYDVKELSRCIYCLNCMAKTALDPLDLYFLKKHALEKLIEEGHAVELGLHYSPNAGINKTKSDVCIQVGDYFFHRPARKEDYRTLPHLGKRDPSYRNPKVRMSIKKAKHLIRMYLDKQ